MTKEQAEFIAWAKGHGYAYQGLSGSGHLTFSHPDLDRTVIASATPSDWRSRLNEKALMLRRIGAKEEKPNSGKYRVKRSKGFTDTYPTPATPDAPWMKAAACIEKIDAELSVLNPRRNPSRARQLAEQRVKHAATLERYFQPVPPLPEVVA